MKHFFISLILLMLTYSLSALSNESLSKNEHPSDQATKPISESPSDSPSEPTSEPQKKAQYFALANYSPFDLLIPSKYGFTLGYIKNAEKTKSADKTWEFEYLQGNISVPFVVQDLGKMTDKRFSVIGRSYSGGNSFNMSYGISYFDFSLHLGDALINRVTGGNYPSVDLTFPH